MNIATVVMTTRPEVDAQAIANQYLATVLGANYQAVQGFSGNGYWYFLIRYQDATCNLVGTGAKLVIDAQTGAVVPLTDEQIRDLAEFSALLNAQQCDAVVRDQRGYVLRSQAKRKATTYLREHLSMHYSASGGLFIPSARPRWQFSIHCQMARVGTIEALETIDVDAQSGGVIPLHNPQLQQIRQRVDALIQHRELASAA